VFTRITSCHRRCFAVRRAMAIGEPTDLRLLRHPNSSAAVSVFNDSMGRAQLFASQAMSTAEWP
jgi:hypothetical protein